MSIADEKISIGDLTPDIDWTKFPWNTLVGKVVLKPPKEVIDKYKGLPELIEVDIEPHKLDDKSPPGKVTRVKPSIPSGADKSGASGWILIAGLAVVAGIVIVYSVKK